MKLLTPIGSHTDMRSDLKVEIITDFDRLETLTPDWERLWALSPRREVFGTWGWARASWRAFGEDRKLSTLVVRRAGDIVGIWPLVLNKSRLQPLSTPHSDYNDLLCDQRDAQEVLGAVLAVLRAKPFSWKRGVVENIPEGGNLIQGALGLIGARKPGLYLTVGSICSTIVFEGNEDFVGARVLGNKHLRRKEKRLSSLGEIGFHHLDDRAEIRELLPDFFRQHVERRALLGERSMFCAERECFFYRCLVDEFDPRSVLRFGVLRLNGKPIGYHLGFEIDRKLTSYKPTFEVRLAKWSPGEVVFKKVFEYVAERGLRECDLTVGLEGFKNRFANRMSRNWELSFFPSGLQGAGGLCKERAKGWVRKRPKIYRMLRQIIHTINREKKS